MVEAGKHPNADKLQLCQLDVGEGELRQIVCGAWNFGAGATVAVGLPGALLPGAEAPLDERKLRGELSRGMILSERELELGADHAGIIVLDDGPEPGTPLADILPIHEQVLDVTPTMNRVDLLSMVGLAREVAALCDGELLPMRSRTRRSSIPSGSTSPSRTPIGCPRYIGRVFKRVEIGPSPLWLRARLHWAEMRSISNVVDITNYVMHVYGSPLHAFDRSLLAGGRIVVRRAHAGEELRTLDGTLRRLEPSDLVITDGEKAVALAAIMGGQESEVSDDDHRGPARGRQLRADRRSSRPPSGSGCEPTGSNRWEKGVDPYMAEPAAVLASRLIVDLAGGELVGSVDVHSGLPERPVVRLRPARTSRVIGLEVDEEEQRSILERLEFEVGDEWDVTVPTWRARDVTREIDVVEEVARVVLDRVPHTTPLRRAVAGHLTKDQRLRRLVEDVLVGAGFSEAFTWSLVAIDPDPDAIRVPDPLTADQAILRTTLRRGLIQAARVNVDAGNQPIALFELARVYLPSGEQLPEERWRVGGIAEGGWAAARRAVEALYAALHLELSAARATLPQLHPGKAAQTEAGWFGELHPSRLEGEWGVFELDLGDALRARAGADRVRGRDHLSGGAPGHRRRRCRGRRDRGARRRRQRGGRNRAARSARLRRLPRRAGRPGKKSVAIHLVFQSPERTLSDDDAAAIRARIVGARRALRRRAARVRLRPGRKPLGELAGRAAGRSG